MSISKRYEMDAKLITNLINSVLNDELLAGRLPHVHLIIDESSSTFTVRYWTRKLKAKANLVAVSYVPVIGLTSWVYKRFEYDNSKNQAGNMTLYERLDLAYPNVFPKVVEFKKINIDR